MSSIEVYEAIVNGINYYVDDSGQYYDPETEEKVSDPYDTDSDESLEEVSEAKELSIDERFGGEYLRYPIFLRAKSWKPYPQARAKKGEKGRADYKKEGRVGFFDDFPEVPYWQGQLGLELYMDKVDFMEGKKKKRKKVARDRLTERIYMYNPDSQMYEERVQDDGYPEGAETAIKIFDNKVCLAEQQGLKELHRYYMLPEGLKELNYYLEEEYDDLFDCNCNHLGKFSGDTMKIVGQANRYDWVKSEVELGMFLAREQVNTILFELNNYQNDPSTIGYDEDLLDYEKQYAEGIQGKGDNFFGVETSKLVAYQASPTADYEDTEIDLSGDYFGQQGYGSVKLVDIRTEEEKLMKYQPLEEEDNDTGELYTFAPRSIWIESNKIVKPQATAGGGAAAPPKKKIKRAVKKEKKPRTQAQLDALAKARERMAKKKAEDKKSKE